MSSLFDMISAFIAFLMSAAFLHFGASDGNTLRDTPPPAPTVAQSHSESTMSPEPAAGPQDAAPAATPVMARQPGGRHQG